MHEKVRNRGIDPTGVADGPYRFLEVVCRDEGGQRYDTPVPWLGKDSILAQSSTTLGSALSQEESQAVEFFHKRLGDIVKPVCDALWNSDDSSDSDDSGSKSHSAAAGFLINMPGSASQTWHRDGPVEGYIDVFVPLIDLLDVLGPTALLPGTHLSSNESLGNLDELPKIVPLLKKGQILLFDYRVLHKGLGNTSIATPRTLAYAVYARGPSSLGDIHNFPDALTLEYD